MGLPRYAANLSHMADKPLKRYIFASDFDQTLTFNDSGYVLAELVGIPTEEFERKAKGMAKINLVQQGAELAYLLLHDPEFKAKVRKEHLHEVGKRIRLKGDIKLLYQILDTGVDGYYFDFYMLSAAPVEVIHSALEGIVPQRSHFRHRVPLQAFGRDRHNHSRHCRLRQGRGTQPVAGTACDRPRSRHLLAGTAAPTFT